MLEIGSNSELPENGASWRQLRSGDFSGMPSLTWSSESALDRDADGHPIADSQGMVGLSEADCVSVLPTWQQEQLSKAPRFMMDPSDGNSLNRMVEWMMAENPVLRPVIDQVLGCDGCRWVSSRSRAAATIFEGNFGPDDDVLDISHDDVEMADMMDTS
jgi:mitosis inhibitor protein kinase SWE1